MLLDDLIDFAPAELADAIGGTDGRFSRVFHQFVARLLRVTNDD